MSQMQTLLLALIPLAFIAWRMRRLLGVIRGGGSLPTKIAVGTVIVLGLASRVSRWSDAFGDVAGMSHAANRPPVPVDSAQMRRAADAEALVAKGLQALAQCDTATANYSFGRVAAVGIEMENADSTAGDPLFYQGVALVGLRDTVNAAWFAAEAIRLDRERHIPARPAHAALLQRVSKVASKKC